MATGEDAIVLLTSIDASLKALVALAQRRDARVRASQPKPVADDRDLDGRYGDPTVKFMPRDWTGDDFKGAKFSQCPPALLDLLADTFDYFARKAEEKDERTDKGKPVSDFKRADAARARGWAKRMREGKVAMPAAAARVESSTSSDWGAPEGWD